MTMHFFPSFFSMAAEFHCRVDVTSWIGPALAPCYADGGVVYPERDAGMVGGSEWRCMRF